MVPARVRQPEVVALVGVGQTAAIVRSVVHHRHHESPAEERHQQQGPCRAVGRQSWRPGSCEDRRRRGAAGAGWPALAGCARRGPPCARRLRHPRRRAGAPSAAAAAAAAGSAGRLPPRAGKGRRAGGDSRSSARRAGAVQRIVELRSLAGSGVQRVVRQMAEAQPVERCQEQDRKQLPGLLVDGRALVEVAVDGLVDQRPVGHGRAEHRPTLARVPSRCRSPGQRARRTAPAGSMPATRVAQDIFRLPGTDRAVRAPPLITPSPAPFADGAYAGSAAGS